MSTTTSIFPSATTWTTPRTDQIKLTTDNCKLFTNSKIEKLQKIVVKSPPLLIQTYYFDTDSGEEINIGSNFDNIFYDAELTKSLNSLGLDITNFVVEKSTYGTLPVYEYTASYPDYFEELYVNNTSFWQQGTNTINLVNDPYAGFLDIFNKTAFMSMILSAYVKQIQSTGLWVKSTLATQSTIFVNADNFRRVFWTDPTSVDPTEFAFRVYYQSLGESVKINTPKTRPTTAQQFTMPFSQQQQIVDSIAQGRNTLATANRTGVRKKEVLRTITDLSQLRKLGAVVYQKDTNGNPTNAYWRLIELEKTVYPRKMVVKETWAENWSFESEYTAVDRRFQPAVLQLLGLVATLVLLQTGQIVQGVGQLHSGEIVQIAD